MKNTIVCCICGVMQKNLQFGSTISFFSFPKIHQKLTNSSDIEVMKRRIAAWKNVVGQNINKYYGIPKVCSEHFHSGKPSYYLYENDIDWMPSKNLDNLKHNGDDNNSFGNASSSNISNVAVMSVSDIPVIDGYTLDSSEPTVIEDNNMFNSMLENDSTTHEEITDITTSEDLSLNMKINTMHANSDKNFSFSLEKCRMEIDNCITLLKDVGISNPEEKTMRNLILDLEQLHSLKETKGACNKNNEKFSIHETESMNCVAHEYGNGLNVFADQVNSMIEESVKMNEKIASLEDLLKKERESLVNHKLINRIRGNDKMIKFYTGLKSWRLFEIIYKLVLPGIEHISVPSKRSIPTEEQFLLVLMKLRLNLNERDLAYRFNIAQSSVSRILVKWIDVMYVRLSRNFMVWPTKESLKNATPTYFQKKFPGVVSIIDCFEIPLERFFNLLGRASTYSSYKSKNTLKYFISITPSGAISYISQGYGGRATDAHITLDKKNLAVINDEKYMDNLREGDVVLADKGFLVEDEMKKRGVILRTPSFVGRRFRLTRQETVYSRKVSNLRIHVERVIGKLRRTYKILTDRVPITCVRSNGDNITYFDKVVFVCCCLTNANPSVVPAR